ncbi:hypothetical protein N7540_010549 [Penicillium herquei]|nr:hypothetical protein N7540_010549 [Penicillium herquei]
MSYASSTFLKDLPRFKWYLEERTAGRLKMPPYEKTVDGRIIVYSGEVFCRVPHCGRAAVPISTTTILRQHLVKKHKLKCTLRTGRMTPEEEAQVLAWYNSLQLSTEEDDLTQQEKAQLVAWFDSLHLSVDKNKHKDKSNNNMD